MGLLDFLTGGISTVAGGIAGAIGGARQKSRQEEAQERAQLINRFSPLSGQRVTEPQVTADPVSSGLAGGFQGFKLGQGIIDANFRKQLQGKLLKAAETGDTQAFSNLTELAEPFNDPDQRTSVANAFSPGQFRRAF